jgi:hypothetical protein
MSAQATISRKYHVALSFAGEDRAYVDGVAAKLHASGVKVFYDRYEEVALWGTYTAIFQTFTPTKLISL